jgi:hypothetical protein
MAYAIVICFASYIGSSRVLELSTSTGHWVDSFRKPEPSIIGVMDTQTHRHFGITFGVAVASAVTTFAVSFFAFRWLRICYQEWRIGHRDIFATWAEMTTLPFSLLASVCAIAISFCLFPRCAFGYCGVPEIRANGVYFQSDVVFTGTVISGRYTDRDVGGWYYRVRAPKVFRGTRTGRIFRIHGR